MIIEPCCCHNQLPQLCRNNEHRLTAFHTNGDVTFEKLYHAVGRFTTSSMVTIITPYLDRNALQYFKYCLSRNWMHDIRILTRKDQIENIKAVMGTAMEHIVVIGDDRVTEASCVFCLEDDKHRLCITGYFPPSSPVDTDNRYRLCNHILLYTNAEPPQSLIWDELTKIPFAPFRTKKL